MESLPKKTYIIKGCCGAKIWKNETCRCEEIKNLQKSTPGWKKKLNNLNVIHNKIKINYDSSVG